ncbi:MAG: T9SS type A sorting domain-containing protein [Chlorobium sp.]|nr:T9SS type A sorting domain-containing protein [Chlorobium sp.]
MKKSLFSIIFYTTTILAQVPNPAFNPMTAPGAIGIDNSEHTLFWENPSGLQYNECYFSTDSALVANMDTSVRIQNGHPSTVFNSVSVTSLLQNTKYFWCVVEYSVSGNSSSPVWYFYTQPFPAFMLEYQFDSDFEGWEVKGPLGLNNWHWLNSSNAGGYPGEMAFFWDPIFLGDSYIMSPEIPCPAGATVMIEFRYYEDWWSDTVVVGSAITSDNGNTWTSIWELHATGNVGPDNFYTTISAPGNFRLGFYYTGDSNNIDFLYIDDVSVFTAITISFPPSLLQAVASLTEQKVTLNWNGGSTPFPPITGYRLERKQGLPEGDSTYITLVETNAGTFTFSDESVELNRNYTYRIATLSGTSNPSHYGNEATAYVPEELTSIKTENQHPSEFSLEQNYPNPFNPTTKIKFSIPSVIANGAKQSQFVILKVYDIIGNEIATLVNEEKQAGNYEVEFNGIGLPSGIYFYQLKAGNFIETKKMILLK